MTLSDLRDKLQSLTGVTAQDVLDSCIQLAATEVWESSDLPDSLQEVRVCTGDERFVTLPWQVHKVRGVKAANNRYSMKLNSIQPHFHDMNYYQNELTCRVLGYAALHTKITNASTLKFKARKPLSVAVTFTVTGEVDNASYVVEPIVLGANIREVVTVERYVNTPLTITKSARTEVDVDILDASGNQLATFPNHLLECRHMMLQMYDRCHGAGTLSGCFDILFKSQPPQMASGTDSFPDPFAQVVLFKSAEQLALRDTDRLDVAAAYNAKALALMTQFTADAVRGKTLEQNIRRDPLTTAYHGKL